MSASFRAFAETCEAIRSTRSRLAKAAAVADYLNTLDDAALPLAARYLAGQPFPLYEQRTTNVGFAALAGALLAVTGADDETLARAAVDAGDLGDATYALMTGAGARQAKEGQAHLLPASPPILTLEEVEAAIRALAAARGVNAKQAILRGLLSRATPLEAKYLVKLLGSDMRIGLQEGAVEDAIARAAGAPVADLQAVNMLLGDLGETALLIRQGRTAEARLHLFRPIKFMLATPVAGLAEIARLMPERFYVEDKFDGIRAQAHLDGDRVVLFSRTLDDITAAFPDLVAPLVKMAGGRRRLILDGEIVPVRGATIQPFAELQKRLGRKRVPIQVLEAVPAAIVCYDLLHDGDRMLISEALGARRALLAELAFDGSRTRLSLLREHTDVSAIDREFAEARARGNEGLMIKDPRSPYRPGRRGREWLKLKRPLATLDVVVTAVELGHGRRNKVLSDYTFAVRRSKDDPELLNIGKAYSGLTDAEIAELSEWFRAHTIQQYGHGRMRIVEPAIVIEVAFDRVQPSNRHKSGYALRFPRIVRLRPDKPVEEIDTLDTVKRLAG